MSKKQTILLLELARKLKKISNSKDLAEKSLVSAGILNEKGKLSKEYPNLKRVLTVAE